jgi:hypothetical protein
MLGGIKFAARPTPAPAAQDSVHAPPEPVLDQQLQDPSQLPLSMRSHDSPPQMGRTKRIVTCLSLDDELAARQMQERAPAKPEKISMGVARPVTAHRLICADVDDRLSLLRQQRKRCGNERFVTGMMEVVNLPGISSETCLGAFDEPRKKHRRT